jgi:hypothetical protein
VVATAAAAEGAPQHAHESGGGGREWRLRHQHRHHAPLQQRRRAQLHQLALRKPAHEAQGQRRRRRPSGGGGRLSQRVNGVVKVHARVGKVRIRGGAVARSAAKKLCHARQPRRSVLPAQLEEPMQVRQVPLLKQLLQNHRHHAGHRLRRRPAIARRGESPPLQSV